MRERFIGAALALFVFFIIFALSRLPMGWVIAGLLIGLSGWVTGGYARHIRLEADRDALTGLNNRRPFERFLAKQWEAAKRSRRPLSLLFVEVDDFGQINKRFGHLMGDEALKEVSRLIRQSVSKGDMLVRWGGDEFVVVLPDTNRESALILAERMRGLIACTSVQDLHNTISITISTGVASYPGLIGTPGELLREAIQGQRAAKMRKNSVMGANDRNDSDSRVV